MSTMTDSKPSVFMRNAVRQKMKVGGASLSPKGLMGGQSSSNLQRKARESTMLMDQTHSSR